MQVAESIYVPYFSRIFLACETLRLYYLFHNFHGIIYFIKKNKKIKKFNPRQTRNIN
jgi:hypothetical protein